MSTSPYLIGLAVLFVLIVSGAMYAAGRQPLIDAKLLLEAIRRVENTPRGWVGLHGERSQWQLKGATWRDYSTKPFEWASGSRVDCVLEQERVAMAHLKWIMKSLPDCAKNDPFDIGMVWCAGYGAWKKQQISTAQYAYAERVENTYRDLEHHNHRISTP